MEFVLFFFIFPLPPKGPIRPGELAKLIATSRIVLATD